MPAGRLGRGASRRLAARGATVAPAAGTYRSGAVQREPARSQLLHQRVLQRQVVLAVDEQLLFEMLRRVKVLARRFFPVTPTL